MQIISNNVDARYMFYLDEKMPYFQSSLDVFAFDEHLIKDSLHQVRESFTKVWYQLEARKFFPQILQGQIRRDREI